MVNFVLDERTLSRIQWYEAAGKPSNYGWLKGGVVRAVMPELEFDRQLHAYALTSLVRMLRNEGFDGIAGKPFLDLFHWSNGEGGEFCLESWAQIRTHQGGG
jgi:hypothetical protein